MNTYILLLMATTLVQGSAGQKRIPEILVMAAGATESTLRDTVGLFEKAEGCTVKITYAPVGLLRDKIIAGERADVAIVTPAIIEQLQSKGLLRADSRVKVGRVGGGIAVRAGASRPPIGTPEELKQALLDAEEVYYADPAIATAGAYFLSVADRLGVGAEVRKKCRLGASGGKEAMELMAKSSAVAIGVTQISEILSTRGVALVGPYPGNLQNLTTYAGVILERVRQPEAAKRFLQFLISRAVQERFRQAGFEDDIR
jgi:molybdate transport system substrate-binding protein